MAEITDQLVLDIDQALRQINQVEAALDRALAPVELRVDDASVRRIDDNVQSVRRSLDQAEGEAQDFGRSLDRAEDEARRLDRSGRDVTTSFEGASGAARTLFGVIAAIGASQGLAALVRGANTAIQAYAELVDSVNAVNVVFKEGAQIAADFGETAAQTAGLSQLAFNQAVAPIGAVLTNFGFGAREAAAASVILVQRAADLASVYGGTVQDALLAVNSALVGQVEPLRRFGAEISVARAEEFALATGLIKAGEALNATTAVQARYGLILKDTAVVAGDFANTSDDLANAQRVATAEVQNFTTEIGEALAPALEALLVVLPEIVDGLRQLVPGFAAAGDSAASFFSQLGGGDTGGLRSFFQSIDAGLALTADAIAAFGDIGSFVIDTVLLDFNKAGRQVDQFGDRISRLGARLVGQGLAKALDAGEEGVTAFANAIAQLAGEQENLAVFEASYRGFAIQAELTSTELQQVTGFLLDNAEQARLSAAEIDFLETQYALLTNTLQTVGNEAAQAARSFGEIDEPLQTATTRFTTFAGDIEGVKDRTARALSDLATLTEAQQQRISAAFNLFEDIPEQLEGSFADAVETLRTQVESMVEFDANLAILRALGLDELAQDFHDRGIEAAGQLAEAVEDIPLAREADQLLRGFAGDTVDGFLDELTKRLVGADISSADVVALRRILTSPEVIDAVEAAGRSVGSRGANAQFQALLDTLDQLMPEAGSDIGALIEQHWANEDTAEVAGDRSARSYVDGVVGVDIGAQIEAAFSGIDATVDLSDEGFNSGLSFFAGLSQAARDQATRDRLRDDVVDAVNSAIEAQSPSRVFLALGESAGDAFWSGFSQSDLTLRVPTPAAATALAGTAAPAVAGGGFTYAPTIVNPTVEDLDTSLARNSQLMSAVAGILNGNFKL